MAADGVLHAYARARMADGDGASPLAVANYRLALDGDPSSAAVARRSYLRALESGDFALALRSARLLDGAGLAPRDATLLQVADALNRKDWAAAQVWTDRMTDEGNFAFLTPLVRSWISLGEGKYAPPLIVAKDQSAALARRYLDEQVALQALARGDVAGAEPAIRASLAARLNDQDRMRLTFAAQLARWGEQAQALSLLPEDRADFAAARSDMARGRNRAVRREGAPLTPAQGFGRLLARLALDADAMEGGGIVAVRLARIATFADPGPDSRIVAARLLTENERPELAVAEARKVPDGSYQARLAKAELVDALDEAGQDDAAIALARSLAAVPHAEPERFIQLGRLLTDGRDFDGAAAAFRSARGRYPADAVPWALLLFEGNALEKGGRWEEARAVLEDALRIAPNEPIILNYLGYAQIERRQNVDQALELLKKASALKPDDPSITDSLGWAQFVTGNVEAAVPVLEKAVVGAPGDPTVNEHLGDALWAAGRRYEARYAWKAAATLADGAVADRLAAKMREGMKPEYVAP
ncbi:TPR repeat protein [Sphingobium cloacae]|uniref:TPR repeat protein n=1 Tax=Sphingobium cloacae TaxID=120107 RepID=A0A1E1F0E7_9SPHN|nr:TPR repeat protein [Sphingobium cloacae]